MSVFENREFNGHETVTFGNDGPTALPRHRRRATPPRSARPRAAAACGPIASTDEAITDALRLSRGMSFKNAMAGLPFGGGKAVIIGDSRRKTPQLFEAFGRFVDTLGGLYITAEDVGTTTADMESVAKQDELRHRPPPPRRRVRRRPFAENRAGRATSASRPP